MAVLAIVPVLSPDRVADGNLMCFETLKERCPSVVVLRCIGPDQWTVWRALRLKALSDSPAAFGSALADWQGTGDTEARWRARLEGAALNLVAELDGVAIGMVSAVDAGPRAVELISLWVAPEVRGHGVGDALVEAVLGWTDRQGRRTTLDVRVANTYAIALYRRHGFADAGAGEPKAGEPPERRMSRQPHTPLTRGDRG